MIIIPFWFTFFFQKLKKLKKIKKVAGGSQCALGGQYYIVYSLGTIFCRMLPSDVQCPGKEGNTGTVTFQYITFRNDIMHKKLVK